jgi:hypothetical protein
VLLYFPARLFSRFPARLFSHGKGARLAFGLQSVLAAQERSVRPFLLSSPAARALGLQSVLAAQERSVRPLFSCAGLATVSAARFIDFLAARTKVFLIYPVSLCSFLLLCAVQELSSPLDVFAVCKRIWVTRDFLRWSPRAICLRA